MRDRSVRPRAGRFGLRFLAGLCACLALPLVLVAQFPLAPATDPLWDIANALGYLALAVYLVLFVYVGRPREFPPFNGRFFANLHRDLGYISLLLVAGHIGLLLYDQPLLLEHLKISAPLYMLAGLLGAVLLLLLVLSSVTAVRRRIWRDYHRFRALHGWLALACVLLTLWHLAGSQYYLNTPLKLTLAGLCCIGVPGIYLRERLLAHPHRHRRRQSRLRDTGVYAHRISVAALAVLLVALVALLSLRSVE